MQSAETLENLQIESHASVFRKSFLYSQGLPDIQYRILAWMVGQGYVSRDIPKEIPLEIMSMVPPRMHDEVHPQSLQDQIWDRWKDFYDLRNQHPFIDQTESVLTDLMLQADLFYQAWERPERPMEKFVDVDSFQDMHASFLRAHAINGISTGSPAFDELFLHLGKVLQKAKMKDPSSSLPNNKIYTKASNTIKFHKFLKKVSITDKLKMLEEEWEAHHSGFSFYEDSRLDLLVDASESDLIQK